jgi:hypothetical protein
VQILIPLFAMFALTAVAVFRLGLMRLRAVRARQVDLRFYREYRGYEEPERLRIASRHVINLFEAPTLFYVVCLMTFVTGQTSGLLVGLAWAYVVLRGVHSYVHLTSNVVVLRFRVFVASWLVLVAMWMLLGVRLAVG